MKRIDIAKSMSQLKRLSVGEEVLLTGIIYTARDQAHKRMTELITSGQQLPFDLCGKIIYYCGPTATPKGKIIGACGPTTASRMDAFVELLLKKGLLAMIGKGRRNKDVIKAIKRYKSVYLVAPAGCGALLAGRVLKKRIVAFSELGPEAIHELTVKDFPVFVAIDAAGNDIYDKMNLV